MITDEMVITILISAIAIISIPCLVVVIVWCRYHDWLKKPPKNKDEWRLK